MAARRFGLLGLALAGMAALLAGLVPAHVARAADAPKLLVWINGDKGYNGLQKVGDAFTRKAPKYERFIRPAALRFKKAHVTHPELNATFASVGAFPFTARSKDAVLYLTLAPGAYTAQVTGPTTGLPAEASAKAGGMGRTRPMNGTR
mgnify:CR=1 FL=1